MSRTLILALLLAICAIPFARSATPQGPSFDCAKAASPVEHAICADPRLSAADLDLSQNYSLALAAAGPYHDDLVAFERAWLKRRGPECGLTPSGPAAPPDIADRTKCLLGLITDRAQSLTSPWFGFFSGRFDGLNNDPPLTLWLLNEAFLEMPFAPKAAEHVFTLIDAAPAYLGHLMTARLFDAPSGANTKLQQTLAAKLLDVSQGQYMLPTTYDGTILGLTSYMGLGSRGLVFPCKLFEQFPDLAAAAGGQFGSSRDNLLPGFACSDYEYPYPHIADKLDEAAAPYDGGVFGRCGGTLRFFTFANDWMYQLISRVTPRVLLQPGIQPGAKHHRHISGITVPAVPDAIPLESWSYQSVWNRHAFANLKQIFDKALAQFTALYETRWGLSPQDAAHAAHVALWLPLLWTDEAPHPTPIALAIMGPDVARALPPLLAGTLPEPKTGEPLLSLAVENADAVKLLLAAHADVNSINDFGKTPLMTAAQFDQAESISLLIKAGAKINQQSLAPESIAGNDTQAGDGQGVGCGATHILHGSRTALMYAAANASLATIRQLLAAGADKTLTDSQGRTAWDYLQGKGPVPPNPRLTTSDRAEAAKLLMPK